MKTFTIKKKRDGGNWKPTGAEIIAENWQDAKRKFTEAMYSSNYQLDWIDDEVIARETDNDPMMSVSWYIGPGLYVQDYANGRYYYSGCRVLDTFSEDVWTWTIRKV